MRRALRIVLAIVKWVAIAGGAVLLVFLLVNSRDQELTPETRSLAEFHPPTVPDGQNAYLALVGFDAPMGVDPISAGARIVAENNAAAANDPSGRERLSKMTGETRSVSDKGRLKFVGPLDALPDPVDRPCLPQALEHAGDIKAMSDANAELVARYLAMQKLPAFANTALPDILSATLPGGWSGPRRLLVLRAALDAQTGRTADAISFLAADIGMWRRVLRGDGALIDEMIAVRVLATDFRVLSDLIAAPTFDLRANEAALREILVPLTPTELDASPMFKKEFVMHARLIAALPGEMAGDRSDPWIDRLTSGSMFSAILFKPNASLNLSAQLYSGLQVLASHPPSDFVLLRDKLRDETRTMSEPGITWVYNPTGRMTVGIAVPWYPEYVARVFDLTAYIQMVRAQLELRLAATKPEGVPAYLASAGAETRNPYTQRPFQWDASDQTLSFEPMSSGWRRWSTKVAIPPTL